MENYEDESELDAEIAKMLDTTPEEDTVEEVVEETVTTDTSEDDHEEQKPEMVELTRYKNLQAKMTKATQENSELRKHLESLQEQINQLQAKPDTTDDEIDTVNSDYPEIVGPLVKKNKALETKIAKLEEMLTNVSKKSESFAQTQSEIEAERWNSRVKSVHPDLDEILSPGHYEDLKGWVESQAPVIQQGFHSGNPDDAITVLNLYKQSKGIKTTEKPDRLAAAKAAATPNLPKSNTKPSSKQTFTREQIAKMSMEEFMKHEAEIDQATVNGEIF